MKLKLQDGIDANVRLTFEPDDLCDVIDSARDAVIKVIVVATVASIFKSIFKN